MRLNFNAIIMLAVSILVGLYVYDKLVKPNIGTSL